MHPRRPRTTTGIFVRAAAAALLALLGLAGTPAHAADGEAAWDVATASNDFGADRQNYAYSLDPGGRVEDGLVIVNPGSTPLTLAVYTADAFTAGDGLLDLAGRDEAAEGIGAWARSAVSEVTVPPDASAEVPFTLDVPDDAAPGDYLGGIVASPTPSGGAEQRRGVRIRLRVGGPLEPGLSVTDLDVRYSGGSPFAKGDAVVTYTIRNTGNAIVSARQKVSLAGPFGKFAVAADEVEDSPQLLPGEIWKVGVTVRGVAPALRLTGVISLTPLLADASGSIAPLKAVGATTHLWPLPWQAPLLAVVCLLVVAFAISRLRRRPGAPADAPAEPAPGEPAAEQENADG
ncbi:uncharacterized protein DUF916 [Actinocorallia herbida]|uniref:Uncharacterized protein DUF916 n=1 Tax=Actinocorallia herbida TaxID=58109 RepID=A0A3N1CSH7_9ACTN|nr:DUF916 domain-containing protein [Actinocorallia herbida]ROO84253.1 uncharacterized protein DUF916 [Actinocorallia herbida]